MYSPSIDSMMKISPNPKRTTLIRDAYPRIGVPVVSFSFIVNIIPTSDNNAKTDPIVAMHLIGKYEKLIIESTTSLIFFPRVQRDFPTSLSFLWK